jgi:hypothetical protein
MSFSSRVLILDTSKVCKHLQKLSCIVHTTKITVLYDMLWPWKNSEQFIPPLYCITHNRKKIVAILVVAWANKKGLGL